MITWLWLYLGSLTLLTAQSILKKYGIKEGMILYDISGGGQLTQETNLTIDGRGKLRFKEWGAVELIEENIEEVSSGAIKNIETIKKCEKHQKEQRLNVDFKIKKILERPMPKGDVVENITKGLVKQGQEKIAGMICDVWEGNGIRKCIYKGIPLLNEINVLGMHYRKKAVNVIFDINVSGDNCSIPNFPIEKIALFKTNLKTKSKKMPKEFSKVLKEVSEKVYKQLNKHNISEADLTEKQKRVWLQKLGQNIFEKQKKLLPQMLLSMQKARVCLQQAEEWIAANECLKDVAYLKRQFTKNKESNIEVWKGEEKRKILNTFDENISLLEVKMRCIRSAQNITDLSSCMK